jgi:BirA family biotin operon repressor/biotin-[acetyl-CoA-carboxylase] ligase
VSPGKGPGQGLAAVLQVLRGAADAVSGEYLAAQLGLSRAAVWKRVHRLKAQGYVIEGSPRRGYRLLAVPDKLLPAEVLQGLQARRLKGPVHHFETLDSTNDLAKELAARGAPEGTVVVAEAQTGGRGRLGREWDSPPAVGLYVSLVLRPMLPPVDLPQITLTSAVAVVRAVRRVAGVAPGIKWPNDLLLNGKKLGGILTEMETESDRIRHVVVGLGLNVNNPEFPAELAATATSLTLATGGAFSRVHLLRAWLDEFDGLYDRFLRQGFAEILAEWKGLAVTLGRPVTVRQGPREISGLALDVAPDGALLLRIDGGEIVRVISGEITPGPEGGPGV